MRLQLLAQKGLQRTNIAACNDPHTSVNTTLTMKGAQKSVEQGSRLVNCTRNTLFSTKLILNR